MAWFWEDCDRRKRFGSWEARAEPEEVGPMLRVSEARHWAAPQLSVFTSVSISRQFLSNIFSARVCIYALLNLAQVDKSDKSEGSLIECQQSSRPVCHCVDCVSF